MLTDEYLLQKFMFLTTAQDGLRRMGVRESTQYRFKETWHEQPLSWNWAATVGSWGGIRTNPEIQELAGVNYENLKKFKSRHGVAAARYEADRVPPWRRALNAARIFELNQELEEKQKIKYVAGVEKILPFELYLYVHCVDELRKEMRLRYVAEIEQDIYLEMFMMEWKRYSSIIDIAARRK